MSAKDGRVTLLALAIFGIALAARHGYAAPANRATVDADRVGGGATPAAPAAQPASSRLSGSHAKAEAPIAIAYDFSAQPELGTPFDVHVSAAGGGAIGDLQLTVVADDGLEAGAPQLITGSADGVRRNWTVSAAGLKNGTLYLTLIVQGTVGGQHPSRTLVVPIRIGA